MNIDIRYLSKRLKCSDTEKEQCLDTVRKVARAYYTARKEGILALLKLGDKERDPFFKECLEYVMSGLSEKQLSRAFEQMLAAGDYHGKEFLEKIIICEGLSAINRDKDECTLMAISPYFGAGYLRKVMKTVVDERQALWDTDPPENGEHDEIF